MPKRHSLRKSLKNIFTSLCQVKFKSSTNEDVADLTSGESTFPEGWFYIKSQINGNVMEPQSLSVNSGARIVVSTQRFGFDADSQLWRYDNGFIINKESGKVLELEGDRIRKLHHTYLCQNDRKSLAEATNQRWVLRPDGYISLMNHDHYVLHVSGHFGFEKIEGAYILVHHRERNFIKGELEKIKDEIKNEQKKLHIITKESHDSGKDKKYDEMNKSHKKNTVEYDAKDGYHDFENSKQRWLFESEHEKPALISPPIPKEYKDYIAAYNETTNPTTTTVDKKTSVDYEN